MPSSRPTKPRCSVVVALRLTWSGSTPMTCAKQACIASIYGLSLGACAQSVISQLADRFGRSEVDRALAGGSGNISFTAAFVPKLNVYRDIRDIQMTIKYIKL